MIEVNVQQVFVQQGDVQIYFLITVFWDQIIDILIQFCHIELLIILDFFYQTQCE